MADSKQDALDELENHFADVVAGMKLTFTTHDFIKALSRQHQHAYIRALHAALEGPYPFQNVHKAIAQRLGASGLVTNVGKTNDSHDLFGQKESATRWERV